MPFFSVGRGQLRRCRRLGKLAAAVVASASRYSSSHGCALLEIDVGANPHSRRGAEARPVVGATGSSSSSRAFCEAWTRGRVCNAPARREPEGASGVADEREGVRVVKARCVEDEILGELGGQRGQRRIISLDDVEWVREG